MKAIILAAGEGKRMGYLSAHLPKSLLKFQGRSLLQYKTTVLKNAGIRDIKIVTGYLQEAIGMLGYETAYNSLYKDTNMLYSLFTGLEGVDDDVIICYGDIIFEQQVLDHLLMHQHAIVVTVDENYLDYWKIRMENPFTDLESCVINEEGQLLEIGNKVTDDSIIDAQYTGLIKVSREGVSLLKRMWGSFKSEMGEEAAFSMSVTPFLNWLIIQGVPLHIYRIRNGWLEFDSLEDLDIYNKLYNSGQLIKYIDVDGICLTSF